LTVDVTSILVSQRQLGGRYLKFFGFQSGQGAIQFSSIILGVVPEPPSALLAILGLSGVAVGYRLLGCRRLAGQAASLVQKA
jgi:xanthosine utilization system XapX-like protein